MTYCTKCGKPTNNGIMCEDCIILDSPWLLAMKSKEDDLIEQIEKLKTENATLRKRLREVVSFALDLCEHEDCAGDDTVGVFACPMWEAADIDDNDNVVECGCLLEKYVKELAEGGEN